MNWKVNQQSTSGAVRYWDMIETMMLSGWTMRASGDGGTKYWAFGDPVPPGVPVTHGEGGEGGLGNNNAWVRLQDPAAGREIIIQRRSSDLVWDFVYSPSAKFISGTPSASVRNTAIDEKLVINNVSIFTTTLSTHHIWASNISPYPFYLMVYPNTGGDFSHFTCMDEIEVHGTDTDNVVFIRGNSSTVYALTDNTFANSSGGLCAFGVSNGNLVNMNMYTLTSWPSVTGFKGFVEWNVPSVAGSTNDVIGPAFFYRKPGLSDSVFKGRAKNFKLAGFQRASCGVTYTVSSARDRIYLRTSNGAVILPWNGVIPIYP